VVKHRGTGKISCRRFAHGSAYVTGGPGATERTSGREPQPDWSRVAVVKGLVPAERQGDVCDWSEMWEGRGWGCATSPLSPVPGHTASEAVLRRTGHYPRCAVPSCHIGRVRCSVGIRKLRGARPTPTCANRKQEYRRSSPNDVPSPDPKSRAWRQGSRDRHYPTGPGGAQARAETLPTSLRCSLNPGPGIAQCHRAVEDEAPIRGVGIDAEVTQPHELVPGKRFCICETGLYLAGG
jgi:hypothetical protein